MAGLTKLEHSNNDLNHLTAITKYVNKFPWQWVIVLTIANQPGTRIPLISPRMLVDKTYPRFKKLVEREVGVPVQDFFTVERGKFSGRTHMNLFLNADVPIPKHVFTDAWHGTAYSKVWYEPYDPSKDVSYWLKEITSLAANICDYGGSVVYPEDKPVQTRPHRKRKSDYNRERKRIRYRAAGVRFA